MSSCIFDTLMWERFVIVALNIDGFWEKDSYVQYIHFMHPASDCLVKRVYYYTVYLSRQSGYPTFLTSYVKWFWWRDSVACIKLKKIYERIYLLGYIKSAMNSIVTLNSFCLKSRHYQYVIKGSWKIVCVKVEVFLSYFV